MTHVGYKYLNLELVLVPWTEFYDFGIDFPLINIINFVKFCDNLIKVSILPAGW